MHNNRKQQQQQQQGDGSEQLRAIQQRGGWF
jgi:hypothetical protein